MNRLVFFIAFLIFTGCNSENKEKEIELRKKQILLDQKELDLNTREKSLTTIQPEVADTTKYLGKNYYVYVVIKVDQPDISPEYVDASGTYRESKVPESSSSGRDRFGAPMPVRDISSSLPQTPTVGYKRFYRETSHFYTAISDIETIATITEDSKYQIMDDYETKLRKKLSHDDQVSFALSLYEHKRISKIISREIFVFNTYAEASISRGSLGASQDLVSSKENASISIYLADINNILKSNTSDNWGIYKMEINKTGNLKSYCKMGEFLFNLNDVLEITAPGINEKTGGPNLGMFTFPKGYKVLCNTGETGLGEECGITHLTGANGDTYTIWPALFHNFSKLGEQDLLELVRNLRELKRQIDNANN